MLEALHVDAVLAQNAVGDARVAQHLSCALARCHDITGLAGERRKAQGRGSSAEKADRVFDAEDQVIDEALGHVVMRREDRHRSEAPILHTEGIELGVTAHENDGCMLARLRHPCADALRRRRVAGGVKDDEAAVPEEVRPAARARGGRVEQSDGSARSSGSVVSLTPEHLGKLGRFGIVAGRRRDDIETEAARGRQHDRKGRHAGAGVAGGAVGGAGRSASTCGPLTLRSAR